MIEREPALASSVSASRPLFLHNILSYIPSIVTFFQYLCQGESLRLPLFICFLVLAGVAPAIKAVLTARRIMDRTDFYKDDFVLDAKYKGYGNTEVNQIGGDDLHQLITYMYRLRTSRGGFVVPLKQNEFAAKAKELDGYGGWLGVYGLSVELACNSYKDYVASIEKQELLMKQEISQLI